MSLHGSLDTFALPDVLTLLSATKKTGELRVVGDRLDGRVWLEAGNLVGTDVGRAKTPVDACFELVRLKEGTFSFDGDRKAPRACPPVAVEAILAEALARLAEWRTIEAVVPSLDALVTLAPEVQGDEVRIRADQWRLLVGIGGGTTVGRVIDRSGACEFEGCRAVKDLVDAGLVQVSAEAMVPVDGAPAGEGLDSDSGAWVEDGEVADDAAGIGAEAPASEESTDHDGGDPFVFRRGQWRSDLPGQIPPGGAVPAGEVSEAAPPSRSSGLPTRLRGATASGPLSPPRPAHSVSGHEGAAGALATALRSPAEATALPADERDELVRQVAGLSPDEPDFLAARVVGGAKAGAAKGHAEVEVAEGEEPINRGLLLKFLSSVRT